MMNTAFQTLERLRRIELNRCRLALGQARRFEAELRNQLQTTLQIQNGQLSELDTLTSHGPVPAATIRLRHDHLADLAVQTLDLNAALCLAEEATQLKIAALIAAEREVKVAEKLQARKASTACSRIAEMCDTTQLKS